MHIAINLGVQKLASFQVDNLLPQEIDHEINMAIRRFINQRYSPASNKKGRGFEQSQKRMDDLRNLLEDYHVPFDRISEGESRGKGSFFGTVYTSPVAGRIFVERFKLPIDYMYLINVKSDIVDGCHIPVTFKVAKTEDKFLRIRTGTGIPGQVIRKIEVPNVEGVLETVFSTNGLRNNMEELLNPMYYSDGFTPSLSFQDGLGDMFSDMEISDSPVADSNEFYLKYPFTVVTEGAPPEAIVYTATTSGAGAEYNGAYAVVTYDYPLVELATEGSGEEGIILEAPYTSLKETRAPDVRDNRFARFRRTLCKSVQHDDIFALLDDPFNTAKPSNIMYTIQENFVDLYSNDKSIPLGITIKYLRKPINVDLTARVGCELAEHTHHELVEMTVKSILESFESPRYQTQSGEVLESE